MNKKKISREGPMYLYKTQVGVKFIDFIGTKYGKFIRSLHYLVITIGYLLFAGILFVIGQTIYIYLKVPEITNIIKTPPLLPLIPYFPQIFGAQSLFPPFYFAYFLIALIVVAFSHEFAHGIFARANNVRIKSTGVAFLGPILGAFVEQDDKQMTKKAKIPQMAILGAGVFANLIMATIFFLLLLATFHTLFVPAGAVFSTYSYSVINNSEITGINNLSDQLLRISTTDGNYLITPESLATQINLSRDYTIAYFDAPAIKAGLDGAVQSIGEYEVRDFNGFAAAMDNYGPGDNVIIKTTMGDYNITFAEHPENSSKAFVGVGFRDSGSQRLLSKIFVFKNPSTYYEPLTFFSQFSYDLFWWVAMINLMVGLFNMLPFGFLDGGRFFYLTMLGITKSEKKAEKAFKIATKVVAGLFVALILVWLISFKLKG